MRIVFAPLIAGKPWNGATIYEQALGGSESAVVYLARELSRRGHEVTVYTHGQPGSFEMVSYRPVQELQISIPTCDVFIASRWVDVLSAVPASIYQILWLHDMPSGRPLDRVAHRIVALTRTHASAWGFAPRQEGVSIIGDGVDLTLFAGDEERDRNRLLWISNPDRGLYLASKIFLDEIHPRWPDLELHVFGRYATYGWPATAERMFLPTPEMLKGEHIFLHEPLPRLGLARELMKAWALWYPTYWPETFCMAALEAQAAGTPVITSHVGALAEVVEGGIITNDFLNAVSQLRNYSRWKKLSQLGRDLAEQFSWAKIAAQWELMIEEGLSNG